MAVALAGTETLTTLMAKGPAGGSAGQAFAGTLPMDRLNTYAEAMIKQKHFSVGYPINQDLNMKDFYQWYVDSGLCNVSMNNVGNPRKASALMNSHDFENEVIEYFAPLFGFKPGEAWGTVTHSGTDGNMHGMYFGVKYLQA